MGQADGLAFAAVDSSGIAVVVTQSRGADGSEAADVVGGLGAAEGNILAQGDGAGLAGAVLVAVSSANVGGGTAYGAIVIVVVSEGVVVVVAADDGTFVAVRFYGGAGVEAVLDSVAIAIIDVADDAAIVLAIALAVVGHGGGTVAAFDGRIVKCSADDAAVVIGIISIGADGDAALHAAVLDGADKAVAHDAADEVLAGNGAVGEGDVLHHGGAFAAEIAEEALVVGAGVDADAADGVAVAVEGAAETI